MCCQQCGSSVHVRFSLWILSSCLPTSLTLLTYIEKRFICIDLICLSNNLEENNCDELSIILAAPEEFVINPSDIYFNLLRTISLHKWTNSSVPSTGQWKCSLQNKWGSSIQIINSLNLNLMQNVTAVFWRGVNRSLRQAAVGDFLRFSIWLSPFRLLTDILKHNNWHFIHSYGSITMETATKPSSLSCDSECFLTLGPRCDLTLTCVFVDPITNRQLLARRLTPSIKMH